MSTDFMSSAPSDSVRPATAPAWPAVGAIGTALLAALLLLPASSSFSFAVAGYAIGALLTPLLTVTFRFGRQAAAKNPFYVPKLSLERLVLLALIVGILAGVGHSWFVATELAKQ